MEYQEVAGIVASKKEGLRKGDSTGQGGGS